MERNNPFKDIILSEEQLREMVGFPSELVKRKVISQLDQHCREFIALSPFVAISTSDQSGLCDVSPRGDEPGFVLVLDDNHLVIPERPGNRRMDTITNIINNPNAGLLFLIPGLGETLRINGRAFIIKDEELLSRMKVRGKQPLLAIGIQVQECFIHCAKAFIRSGLWNPESCVEKEKRPSAAKILKTHINLSPYTVDKIEKILVEDYSDELY